MAKRGQATSIRSCPGAANANDGSPRRKSLSCQGFFVGWSTKRPHQHRELGPPTDCNDYHNCKPESSARADAPRQRRLVYRRPGRSGMSTRSPVRKPAGSRTGRRWLFSFVVPMVCEPQAPRGYLAGLEVRSIDDVARIVDLGRSKSDSAAELKTNACRAYQLAFIDQRHGRQLIDSRWMRISSSTSARSSAMANSNSA